MAGTEPQAWETGRMNSITYVGLDVHEATVSVAVAEGGRGGEVRQLGVFENRAEVLSKLAARLRQCLKTRRKIVSHDAARAQFHAQCHDQYLFGGQGLEMAGRN